MKIKTMILSVVALCGMAAPVFAQDAKNNEHDVNTYGKNYTDGDKFDGLTRKSASTA